MHSPDTSEQVDLLFRFKLKRFSFNKHKLSYVCYLPEPQKRPHFLCFYWNIKMNRLHAISFPLSLAPSPILLCRFMYFYYIVGWSCWYYVVWRFFFFWIIKILTYKHKKYLMSNEKVNRKGFLSKTNLTGISKSFVGFKWNFSQKKLGRNVLNDWTN